MMCQGGEGGVKGLDRASGGEAALDSARVPAMVRVHGKANRILRLRATFSLRRLVIAIELATSRS
jgi:hypothetical protein